MKPLSLVIENIGPFVERTSIDFSKFGESSLFLISGKTGSGKTFIFDSICYALFGDTPSGREDNLASDFMRPGDRPSVVFSFAIGRDTFEVERVLEHEDRKGRGTGTTIRGEKQTLRRLSPEPEVLATKKTEVNKRCEELLQLRMDQFSRVIMIPQGEFRELLRSNTEDREKLLRQLFRSHTYLDIAKALDEDYKSNYGKYLDLKAQTGVIIDQLRERLPTGEQRSEGEAGIATFVEQRDRMISSLGPLKENMKGISDEYDEARRVSSWMDNVLRLQRSRADLLTEMDSMEKRAKPEIEHLKELEKRHVLASELAPLMTRASDKAHQVQRLESKLSFVMEGLSERKRAMSELEKEGARLPELRTRYETILSKQGRIEELGSDLDLQKKVRKAINDNRRREKRLMSEQKDISCREERALSELIRFQKEIQERSVPVMDLEVGKAKQIIVTDLLKVLGKKTALGPELESTLKTIGSKKVELAHASEEVRSKRSMREGSIAYELSSKLEMDGPCPVCGSREHPMPAPQPDYAATLEEIEAAEEVQRKVQGEIDLLNKRHSALEAQVSSLEERVSQMTVDYPDLKEVGPEGLEEIKGALDQAMRAERKRGSELERLIKELNEKNGAQRILAEEKLAILSSLEGIRKELTIFEAQQKEVVTRIEGNIKELSQLVPGIEDIEKVIEGLSEERSTLPGTISRIETGIKEASDAVLELSTAINGTRSELETARTELDRLRSELGELLRGPRYSMFATQKDLEEGLLDPDRLREVKLSIERFDSELSRLRGRVEQTEKELKEVMDGKEAPTQEDRERQKTEEASKKASLEASVKRLRDMEHEVEEFDSSLKRIGTVSRKMSEMEPDLAVMRELTEQVKGNGRPKISLERFFLARRFEEVLIEANTRLRKLSEGRFDLSREDEIGTGGGAKSGLDIIVNDNVTGTSRPANTLSGGQMFLTSLALALGLADVVQARSGGVRMDALFIDEGFGALDEETLQVALKVLSELRKGRMVGVISHVQELKRQIPQRIEVLPGTRGSILKIVT